MKHCYILIAWFVASVSASRMLLIPKAFAPDSIFGRDTSNLFAMNFRYQPRIVSGLAVAATPSSGHFGRLSASEGLFRSEVNLFGHVVEADLIMPENVVSSQNVSGSSSAEKSDSARELIGVTLQVNAHL